MTADTDTVSLSSSLVIQQQSIGVASTAQGFSGVDGILGVGPTDLTQGTVANTSEVPTVTDNLFAQGTITEDTLGISFEPTTTADALNGELTFGGTDSTKCVCFSFSFGAMLTSSSLKIHRHDHLRADYIHVARVELLGN